MRVFVRLRARRDANREYRSALDVAMSSEVSLYSKLVRIALVHCGTISLDDEGHNDSQLHMLDSAS